MTATTTQPQSGGTSADGSPDALDVPAVVIIWCGEEPHRIGEVGVVSENGIPHLLGRGLDPSGGQPRVRFLQQRPGAVNAAPPLAGAGISRRQLLFVAREGKLDVERVGRCTMLVNGEACDRASLNPCDVVRLHRQLALVYLRRRALIPALRYFPASGIGAFGEPDAYGFVGESMAAWQAREHIAFAANSEKHVLLTGETGTGKELAAKALHALSGRARGPFVSRNAATLPPGLVDAELFGNVRNYPNAGMPERIGLIGEADGGTLFLDEIGELSQELQSHFLRVLDADGEYQRLGESKTRRSRLRVVAATNRDPASLKHDLAARLVSRVRLPSLAQRRDDIPLLANHLFANAASAGGVATRFVSRTSAGKALPRLDVSFVEHLVRSQWAGNLRAVDAMLWRAMQESADDVIRMPPDAGDAPARIADTDAASERVIGPNEIRDALAR
ncbi:MAG TPA: sigma 54-interacting transcriptional regulator, partial [Polyangiaceae bacterium]|nr:sigma 54-interacting transcriptional regulator [Polyangiaceae bacterium]